MTEKVLNDRKRAAMHDAAIPEYMHEGLIRYFELGVPPGDFLRCVLNNDLRGAALHADETNIRRLHCYVRWLYNHAPIGSWGHNGAVEEYCKARRAEVLG